MIGCRRIRFLICDRQLSEQVARYDGVNIDERVSPIDRVENPPIPDSIFRQARQIRRDRLVAQVVYVRGDPFGFIEEPLGHGRIDLRQVLNHGRSEGEAKPGHGRLPAQPEFIGHIVA